MLCITMARPVLSCPVLSICVLLGCWQTRARGPWRALVVSDVGYSMTLCVNLYVSCACECVHAHIVAFYVVFVMLWVCEFLKSLPATLCCGPGTTCSTLRSRTRSKCASSACRPGWTSLRAWRSACGLGFPNVKSCSAPWTMRVRGLCVAHFGGLGEGRV